MLGPQRLDPTGVLSELSSFSPGAEAAEDRCAVSTWLDTYTDTCLSSFKPRGGGGPRTRCAVSTLLGAAMLAARVLPARCSIRSIVTHRHWLFPVYPGFRSGLVSPALGLIARNARACA